jgi:hypothetical protein
MLAVAAEAGFPSCMALSSSGHFGGTTLSCVTSSEIVRAGSRLSLLPLTCMTISCWALLFRLHGSINVLTLVRSTNSGDFF